MSLLLLEKSGLLENDDIVVSRKDNSYVFTAVVKKPFNPKKANGVEQMLKKAGAGNIQKIKSNAFE